MKVKRKIICLYGLFILGAIGPPLLTACSHKSNDEDDTFKQSMDSKLPRVSDDTIDTTAAAFGDTVKH